MRIKINPDGLVVDEEGFNSPLEMLLVRQNGTLSAGLLPVSILHWRCENVLREITNRWPRCFNSPLEMHKPGGVVCIRGRDRFVSILHWRCSPRVGGLCLPVPPFQFSIGDARATWNLCIRTTKKIAVSILHWRCRSSRSRGRSRRREASVSILHWRCLPARLQERDTVRAPVSILHWRCGQQAGGDGHSLPLDRFNSPLEMQQSP